MKKDLRYAGGLWHMAVFVLNLFFNCISASCCRNYPKSRLVNGTANDSGLSKMIPAVMGKTTENSFLLNMSGDSLPDHEAVLKTVKKQQKFYSKNGGNVEAMELLLKLESVVRGDMTFESCSNDGQPGDGDNGLPV